MSLRGQHAGHKQQKPDAHVRPERQPTAANLYQVIRVLQRKTGVYLEVRASAPQR